MPYHNYIVVDECKRRLVAGGFSELKEKDPWKISPGGKVRKTCTHTCVKRARSLPYLKMEPWFHFMWTHLQFKESYRLYLASR